MREREIQMYPEEIREIESDVNAAIQKYFAIRRLIEHDKGRNAAYLAGLEGCVSELIDSKSYFSSLESTNPAAANKLRKTWPTAPFANWTLYEFVSDQLMIMEDRTAKESARRFKEAYEQAIKALRAVKDKLEQHPDFQHHE